MRAAHKGWASSSAVHVLFAFFVMGGWAVFANLDHALPQPIYAGMVQGALSAGLTLFLKSVIEGLSKRFGGFARLWAPPLIACLGSACLLIGFHTLAATPEIATTVAVPLLVSTSYAAVYNSSIVGGKVRDHDRDR